MKKLFIIMAGAMIACAANATEVNENDTLKVVNPDSVLIIRNDNNVKVNVYGNGSKDDYRYSMDFDVDNGSPVTTKEHATDDNDDAFLPLFSTDKKSDRWYLEGIIAPSILWGGNFVSGAPDNVDIDAFRSFDLWIPKLLSFEFKRKDFPLILSINDGIEWSNYRMKSDKRFDLENSVVDITDYPTGVTPDFSRLKVFTQTLTLEAKYEIAKHAHLRLGPVLNFNIGLSVLTKYKDNGKTTRDKQNNPKVNQVTFSLMGGIDYNEFGFFVKYTPKNVFKAGYGPEFSNTTVGVCIGW